MGGGETGSKFRSLETGVFGGGSYFLRFLFLFFSVHINIKRNIKKKLSMTWEKSLYRTIQCTADAPASPSPVY